MENLSLLTILFLLLVGCEQAKEVSGFNINGSVSNAEGLLVTLGNREKGEWINIDSATVENGTFTLSGEVNHPQLVYLKFVDSTHTEYLSVFIENSDMTVQGDLEDADNIHLLGSAADLLHTEFYEHIEELYEPWDTMESLLMSTSDEFKKDSIQKLLTAIEKEEISYTKSFVEDHGSSQVAPYLAIRHLTYSSDYSELKPIYDNIKAQIPESKYLTELNTTLEKLKILAVGNPAPDFTEVNVDGEEFQLSSLKGKYILVDFWASWCGPCRRENPNVVAMYNEIGNERFEIVGVSLDKDREKWLSAIADDGLVWYQVSDLKGWKSKVADTYNVKAIPSTYLLDPEGRVIAKNLRGEDLKKKIMELLASES